MTHPENAPHASVVLVSTGDDDLRLTRMEAGFRAVLADVAEVRSLRLGTVRSLRVAYYNAARLIADPDALLILLHQDVVPVSRNDLQTLPAVVADTLFPLLESGQNGAPWWQMLLALEHRGGFGFAGVAGSRELKAGKAWWQHEKLSGLVMHRRMNGIRVNRYGPWMRVLALDGLCLICRARTLLRFPPPAGAADHFHFYDLDLCLETHSAGLCNWTVPLLLLHDSGGASAADGRWRADRVWFESRFGAILPQEVPDQTLPGWKL